MSTTDPDARSRVIQRTLRPLSLGLLVIAIAAGPVCGFILRSARDPDSAFVGVYLTWLFLVVGAGLLANYTLGHVAALSLAAYCVAGLGGMFAVFSGGDRGASPEVAISHMIPAIVPYLVAALLYGLHLWRRRLQKMTTASGVNTQATVTRSGVTGMYNYVQIFHLTLSFVDQSGTTRFIRTYQTSVGGWAVGDKISIRYDPQHPNWTWAIIVTP